MEGHQGDHAAVVGAVRDLVRVGDQRHLLEEVGQRPARVLAVELAGHRDQFL